MEKCVVLFSGGIDSTTALYWAVQEGKNVRALTFDYGQRHAIEIQMAQEMAKKLKITHDILSIDLRQIKGSSLTDLTQPLPEFQSAEEIEPDVPSTYVPFRNGIFLSMAAAWAEVQNIRNIVCGFNVIDSPPYPDTTLAFVEAMGAAINSGTRATALKNAFKIQAPFIHLTKSEIIKIGLSLGADYSYSISCYSGQEIPCLKCSSCLQRQKAWESVGTKDPLLERLEKEGIP
jgi:7-cyano-7-deazaguanine synthase